MAKEFVLVHGMSHGAWAWDALVRRLEKEGHRAIAVDLPGHGRRAHERARASVDGYAQAVAEAMIQSGVSRGIVVGHSMAGVVIPKVAERVPARVAHLVFLAAVVLRHGESLLGTQIAAPTRPLMEGLARAGGGVVQYPAAMETARWLNDLPAGDARVVDALTRMTPQPLRPWAERVDLRAFEAMDVPRTYVRCLRDNAVTAARAAQYAARLGVTPVDLDCAHEPMLSALDDLVTVLEKIPTEARR
ncbi:MAG TPA: alpha/beta fold hydrolase [Methylomirabilota bacterium]|jgi:pimeloyl-ACP methyl ester carboxylesterase|nr:alpha/beta fold hydrolase [Methylomirabilota bacterium]